MPKYFEYLVKAKRLGESATTRGLAVSGTPGGSRALTEPELPTLADADEWAQLADRLWAGRASEDRVSIGVFPCPNADDDGAFVASLGLLLREAMPADTLLIDFDTERPALGRNLRTPNSPGWYEMFQSEPTIRLDCVHQSPWRGMLVMPAGTVRKNYRAAELERQLRWLHTVVSRDFRAVVTRFPRPSTNRSLRGCYRVPDAVILTARPGTCRASEVRREAKALRSAGANLVGVILTKAPEAPQEA